MLRFAGAINSPESHLAKYKTLLFQKRIFEETQKINKISIIRTEKLAFGNPISKAFSVMPLEIICSITIKAKTTNQYIDANG